MNRSVRAAAALSLALGLWLYREDWKELYAYLRRRYVARQRDVVRAQREADQEYLREQLDYELERYDRERWFPPPWSPIHLSVLPPTSSKSNVMPWLMQDFWANPGAMTQKIDLSGSAELGAFGPTSGTDDGIRHGRDTQEGVRIQDYLDEPRPKYLDEKGPTS